MSSRYFELHSNRKAEAEELEVKTPSNGNGSAAAPVKERTQEASTPAPSLDPVAFRQPEHTRNEILQLVHRVFVMPRATGSPRLVLICALGEGEAESVAAWTAEMLAGQNFGSVCIVDANTRSPKMHSIFSVPDDVGFCDYVGVDAGEIKNPRSFAQSVGDSNLWVMPAGNRTAEQTAITSELLVAALVGLRSNFDYVLINAPLTTKQAMSTVMAPLTDGVVLVIGAGDTRREIVLKAKSELEASQARVLGAVLHNRRFPVPQFLYKRLF